MYALAVIEHATREIRILGTALNPTGEWTAQMARNFVMDLEDTGSKVKFLIRDRDSNFTAAFDPSWPMLASVPCCATCGPRA